jgi:hypothetical protein
MKSLYGSKNEVMAYSKNKISNGAGYYLNRHDNVSAHYGNGRSQSTANKYVKNIHFVPQKQ